MLISVRRGNGFSTTRTSFRSTSAKSERVFRRLLSGAAEARDRNARTISASVRYRHRAHSAHRRASVAREHHAFRGAYQSFTALKHGRAVGRSHDVASGTSREHSPNVYACCVASRRGGRSRSLRGEDHGREQRSSDALSKSLKTSSTIILRSVQPSSRDSCIRSAAIR